MNRANGRRLWHFDHDLCMNLLFFLKRKYFSCNDCDDIRRWCREMMARYFGCVLWLNFLWLHRLLTPFTTSNFHQGCREYLQSLDAWHFFDN